MKLRTILLLLVFSAFAATLWSDDFWDKKESAEWSDKEATRILESSPWADKYLITEQVIQQTSRSADAMDRDTVKEMWYRVQFWSALPVRQAQVRVMQVRAKYNSMSDKDKQAFQEKAKQLIEQPFPNSIVLRVTYGSNVQDYDRKMASFWQKETTDTQKSFFILVADGKRIPLSSLQVSTGGAREFYVVFPRIIDGQPVLTGPQSKLAVEFQHPDVASASTTSTRTPTSGAVDPSSTPTSAELQPSKNSTRVLVQFKPSKMVYHGDLSY